MANEFDNPWGSSAPFVDRQFYQSGAGEGAETGYTNATGQETFVGPNGQEYTRIGDPKELIMGNQYYGQLQPYMIYDPQFGYGVPKQAFDQMKSSIVQGSNKEGFLDKLAGIGPILAGSAFMSGALGGAFPSEGGIGGGSFTGGGGGGGELNFDGSPLDFNPSNQNLTLGGDGGLQLDPNAGGAGINSGGLDGPLGDSRANYAAGLGSNNGFTSAGASGTDWLKTMKEWGITPGTAASAALNLFTQNRQANTLNGLSNQAFQSAPINQAQRLPYQADLLNLVQNPSSFFATNPLFNAQKDQAKQAFEADYAKKGMGGTSIDAYMKNIMNVGAGTYFDQGNLLSTLGGFNQGSGNANAGVTAGIAGANADRAGINGIGTIGANVLDSQKANEAFANLFKVSNPGSGITGGGTIVPS